ncbi:MAG: hypothetical protein HGA33_06170 [Candidatus Moranbacteria bacterium]|nr:hypothetical protein [Candidatus Moranbacteria bacterium]
MLKEPSRFLDPKVQDALKEYRRELARGTGDKGKIRHCLSHIVMAIQAASVDDPSSRGEAEKRIRDLFASAKATKFPEETSEKAKLAIEEFESVVFPSAPEKAAQEGSERPSEQVGLPEHLDAEYMDRVNTKYEEILSLFETLEKENDPENPSMKTTEE